MNSSTRFNLVTRLNADPQFNALKSNTERIAYLLENACSFDKLKELVQGNFGKAWDSSRKSPLLAVRYYQEADTCFKTERLDAALTAVHKAILHTSPHETAFVRLFAHKWRIHFHLKDYQAMLYSAEVCFDLLPCVKYLLLKIHSMALLRQFSAAIELIDQVIGEQTSGEFKLKSQSQKAKLTAFKREILELSKGKKEESKCVPQKSTELYFSHKLAPSVKIINSPVVGRHFVATQSIPKNVVILQERPYSLVLELDYWKVKCANCNINLGHKYFPCAYCTEPIFCDRACFQAAYKVYHRYECGLASLARSQMTMSAAHVFRIFSRMGPLNAFDVEEETNGHYSIDQYLAEFGDDVDLPEEQWTPGQKEKKYRMSSILWHHDEKHSSYYNAQHCVVAVEVAVLLDLIHNFRKYRPGQDFLLAFASCILVNMRRITFNVFGWHEYNDDDWSTRGHVANCQCLVGSLINHSCECNVSWAWADGIITFTTKRAIAAGEQITITYGPGKGMEHYKRQERLNYYFFACNCNLCLKDAKIGNNLRCRRCNGPVVFNSAQNKEPQLNGKCISCFEKYENFEESVKLLTEVKETIFDLANLTTVFQSENILKKATKLLTDLVDLSLLESETICQSVLLTSLIFEQSSHLLVDEGQKLELALLFDRALPQNIPKHLNEKCLRSLKFWLNVLLKKTAHSVESIAVAEEEKEQMNRYLESANNLKRRFLNAVETMNNNKSSLTADIVKQLTNNIYSQL